MPTATSMGDGDPMRISATPKNMPTITSGHAIWPPTMPLAMSAMRPAWGAGSAAEPMVVDAIQEPRGAERARPPPR